MNCPYCGRCALMFVPEMNSKESLCGSCMALVTSEHSWRWRHRELWPYR